jgi:uncharacterized membrane protein YbhN (UPF0104 family)
MQMNKNIKIFVNYFLGPLLFAWLSYAIYRQIIKQPQLEESWLLIRQSFQSYKIIYLVLAVLLIPANWGLEAWKWMISVRTFYPVKFLQAFKAVLSGVSFSVTMPNRVGEYFGRIMYLPEGNRLKTISVTLVGSFAQLLITIIVGTVGLLILKSSLVTQFPPLKIWYQFIFYGLVVLVFILLLIYFNVAGTVSLFNRWIKSRRYIYLVEALQKFHTTLLVQVLLLSFLRYLIFIIQYVLVFYLFEVNVATDTIATVMSVVFLAMAVIPSIALVEVWLRGEISIKLMGLFSTNTLGIGFTSVTVWFINLILPAIAGSLLILSLRVFKNENESL